RNESRCDRFGRSLQNASKQGKRKMGINRVDIVVYDIIKAIREVIDRHDVTHQEYLKAQQFMLSFLSAKEYEIPLMLDIFFDATIHDVEMKHRKGSVTNTQGPYFKPDCP